MVDLPGGVVTFLMTDVEGSTRAWEASPESMMEALKQHDDAIESAVAAHHGVCVKPRGEGDSHFIVFGSVRDAVAGAAEMQRRLAAVDWVTPHPLLVRAALHTGGAEVHLDDYYGSTVNRVARLRAIAHGGQTIMSRATWELVQDRLPVGVTIRDMGEHRLKDLTRPEHVFQLDIAGLRSSFPPLTSLEALPNNLPRQLTEFVGRDSELAEVTRLLRDTRLLTIQAPGGAGKTRLAIQAAADLAAEHPDGVFFIGLADITSDGDIVQAVSESLGLGLSSDEDVETQLLTYLGNKRQLLIFDNFEHLRDRVGILTEILRAAPEVTVLVTSRAKLNLMGETVLTIGGLETTWATPEEAFQASGVELFLDGAARSDPGFRLAGEDLDAVAEILRLTGGMPLAILLAAAWVDMLPVREIAAEIAKSLDFLETEIADIPDRHRSVRAVFDYSWSTLGEDERTIFAALSVFRGGFTREAAHEVVGASLRHLANLAGKSLVTSSPDTGRYAVHELLRQFAEEELLLDQERAREVRAAHAAFYAGVMDDASALIFRCDQRLMASTVEGDIDNIRVAWRHYLATNNPGAVRRFVPAFYLLYELRGWYRAGLALFDEVVEAFDEASADPAAAVVRGLARAAQAWSLALLGQPDAGMATVESAIETMGEAGELIDDWIVLQCRAICLAYVGRSDDMAAALDAGLARCAQLDDPYWTASLKNWRSFAAVLGGDSATASILVPEALHVLEARHDHYFTTWSLWLLALIATEEGRPQDAIDLFGRQVIRAREIDYLRGSVVAAEGLGDANVAAGRLEAAESAYIESLAAAEQMGMLSDMLGLMTKIGKIRGMRDRAVEAVELLAMVHAQPIGRQQSFTEKVPIRDTASEALETLRAEMDPAEYEAAHARGVATPFETAAKDLLRV